MATWAIGDLQGCFEPLQRLLEHIEFQPDRDRLLFCGDLINRGPESLETLRWLRQMDSCVDSVLGNHDLHALAVYFGQGLVKRKDSIDTLIAAADAGSLFDWLLHRPLLIDTQQHLICHAGIPPAWNLTLAKEKTQACERALRSDPATFFADMYGNEPSHWTFDLPVQDQHRYTINGLTRMRYCHPDGRLDFADKTPPQQSALLPWFALPSRVHLDRTVAFGHWSTLGQVKWPAHQVVGLDTGCVWGGPLSAYCLETQRVCQVDGLAQPLATD